MPITPSAKRSSLRKFAELNAFSSKYDHYLRDPQIPLTAQELLGLKLFEDDDKGKCAECHPVRPEKTVHRAFHRFQFDNLGLPKNPRTPPTGCPRN